MSPSPPSFLGFWHLNKSSIEIFDEDLEKYRPQRPLPHEWLPSAGACVTAFLWATLNVLFYLMGRWSIDFRRRAFYSPTDEVCAGAFVHGVLIW